MTHRLTALAATLTLAATAFAQAPAKPAAAHTAAAMKLPTISYETYTLPNGLKVITHVDHRLPIVAVDLWYHVGPLNEKPGRTGFAHLFEHMMFEGSEHVGEKAHIKFVEAAGATDVNGTTDFDRTNYFETMPANQLELALWLESDRMGFLMEGLDRVKLANQRDVVRNERRQGEGRPYEVAQEELFHQLFPKGHPYYGNVIGSHQDIESARIADVRDFHQQFYTPNNASIAIAGDFDPVKLKALLTKYFGPIPRGPEVEPVHVTTPPITSQKRVTVTDTVQLPQIQIGWLTPAAFTPASYSLDAATFALGGSKASRLDEALVLKSQVAQSASCYTYNLKLTSLTGCTITAKPGIKLEDLEKTFWEELKKLQTSGPTAEEVEAAKAQDLTQKITGLQRLGGFGGVADTLDRYNQYTGDPGYLARDVAAEEAVTVASTRAAAAKYLTPESAVVVYCVKGEKKLDDVPRSPDSTDADVKLTNPYSEAFETAQNWRKTPPSAGPAVTPHLPVPATFSLSNGLKVYVVPDHALPVLSVAVLSRAGNVNNTAPKAGLASMTGQLLDEATTTRDVEKLAQDQERIGTRVGGFVSMDSASQSITILTKYLNPGLDLLSDVVQHPAFSPDDIERLRKQRLVNIARETDSVNSMSARVGPKLLFGDQPYGLPSTGTTDSVKALTRDDIDAFYKSHYGPADSAVIFAGDITLAQARAEAEKFFGKWSGTAATTATVPAPPAPPTTHVVIVDKPGAPQTALAAYGLGVPVSSPDYQTIQIMNYTLGGAFASRINMNLREEHGYTYGASSNFIANRDGGYFQASGLVRTNVTGPAAKELMAEITKFTSTPSTPAELKEAIDARVQSLPGQFATTSSIVGSVGNIFINDRPLDYFATLPAKYSAVTADDVARAAREYVHPGQLIIVAAGDRSKIESQLKDANLGPVEVRDIQGNLVTSAK